MMYFRDFHIETKINSLLSIEQTMKKKFLQQNLVDDDNGVRVFSHTKYYFQTINMTINAVDFYQNGGFIF